MGWVCNTRCIYHTRAIKKKLNDTATAIQPCCTAAGLRSGKQEQWHAKQCRTGGGEETIQAINNAGGARSTAGWECVRGQVTVPDSVREGKQQCRGVYRQKKED